MLTGKQKRQMRAQANQMKAGVMIGKEGLSSRVKVFIDEAFNNKDLVKVKILENCTDNRKIMADKLNQLPKTEVVQILGRTILLYRPLEDD